MYDYLIQKNGMVDSFNARLIKLAAILRFAQDWTVKYLLPSWILYHRLTTFFKNEFSWYVLYFHFTHHIELQTWNPLCNFNLEIPFVFEPISRVSVIASISSVIYAYYRSFQICNVLHTPYTNTKSSKSAIYMHKKG